MRQGAKRIVLEIGHGGNPLPKKAFIAPNQIYLGIDNPKGILRRLKVRSAERSRRKFDSLTEGRNVFFARADGSAIPVKDASVSKIHIHNLFNDGSISDSKKAAFLNEAHRLLKKGGKLYVYNNFPGLYIEKKSLKEFRKRMVSGVKSGKLRQAEAKLNYANIVNLASASRTGFEKFIANAKRFGVEPPFLEAFSRFSRVKTMGSKYLKQDIDGNSGRKGELLVFEKK